MNTECVHYSLRGRRFGDRFVITATTRRACCSQRKPRTTLRWLWWAKHGRSLALLRDQPGCADRGHQTKSNDADRTDVRLRSILNEDVAARMCPHSASKIAALLRERGVNSLLENGGSFPPMPKDRCNRCIAYGDLLTGRARHFGRFHATEPYGILVSLQW